MSIICVVRRLLIYAWKVTAPITNFVGLSVTLAYAQRKAAIKVTFKF
jgi:hypothetical protein